MARQTKSGDHLQELRVDVLTHKPRRNSDNPTAVVQAGRENVKVSSRSNDFVYVNNAYVGSLNSVSENRLPNPPTSIIADACVSNKEGVTIFAILASGLTTAGCSVYTAAHQRVIREQYWACSKWPFGQRVLAIAVGILLGAVIGLAVAVVLTGGDPDNVIGGIFRSKPAPD